MKSRALVLQHQRNAPPALLSDWARQRRVELVVVRADRTHELPAPDGFDFAFTLGSDHSAGQRKPPWVDRELEWLRLANLAAVPILGICFGAQALAIALGGSIERARHPEIGWVWVQSQMPDLVGDGPWFAWHEDVFVLPSAATEIARNAFGPQAFVAGPHLGVQFHPEVTPEVAAMWSARPSGVRWLALAGLDLGRLHSEGLRYADQAGTGGLRLFDAFVSRATSHLHLPSVGERT
ncbi:MAG: type 1 glutamine amidotransferase [Solirubrobacteraceae bacterium]